MKIHEFINKTKAFIGDTANTVKDYANAKKASLEIFNEILMKCEAISLINTFEKSQKRNPDNGRIEKIHSLCLNITYKNAELIDRIIPLNEIILDIKSFQDAKTNVYYILVLSSIKIWIINENGCTTFNYRDITNFEIIDSNILSQKVHFNNFAVIVECSKEDTVKLKNLIMNENARKTEEKIKSSHLCGIIPILELTNKKNKGISISVNNEIVIHNGANDNILVNPDEIKSVQLLLDNYVVLDKNRDNQRIISSQRDARKMTLKIILQSKEVNIDILEENIMSSLYKIESTEYQNSYNLASEIINILGKLSNKW